MDIEVRFDSITQFERYLTSRETTKTFADENSLNSQLTNNYYFTRTKDFEEANNYLLYGDRALAKKIEAAGVAKVRQNLSGHKYERKNFANVVGYMPHVPNFVAGVPLAMIDTKRVSKPIKQISIVYNITADGGTDALDMIDAAAKLLSAIMQIEASGIRCNLYTSVVSECKDRSKQHAVMLIKVKSSDKKLDVLKCAYPIVSPSMLRRHYFRFMEVTDNVHKTFCHGYGHVVYDKKQIRKHVENVGVKNAVIISFEDIRNKWAADVKEYVIKEATEQSKAK